LLVEAEVALLALLDDAQGVLGAELVQVRALPGDLAVAAYRA
jgi:hypothetical protein